MSLKTHVTENLRRQSARHYDAKNDLDFGQMYRSRLQSYRRALTTVVKLEKPTNILRARSLGYKAKPGITVVRVRMRRGGGGIIRPNRARKPKRMGVNKITRRKNIQAMAEERVARRFPNMEVLNSYWTAQDGKNKFYEVILVDPHAPSVLADKDLKWIAMPQHTKRVFRGKTSAARKSRGLRKAAGKRGTEKTRPSQRAHNRKGK